MKTKKEILKMTKKEIIEYKQSIDTLKNTVNRYCSDCSGCSNCSGCSDCYRCSDCYNCSDCFDCYRCSNCYDCSNCYGCKSANNLKYAICNIEVGQKEYEKKIKEFNN